jgi:hypothetical protein
MDLRGFMVFKNALAAAFSLEGNEAFNAKPN